MELIMKICRVTYVMICMVTSNGSTSLSEFIDLIILPRTEYNETRVQCVIENDDGDSVKVSNTGTLYIQGTPIHMVVS